jgi:hypothetical protein
MGRKTSIPADLLVAGGPVADIPVGIAKPVDAV